ncbi:hypothetical protein ACFQ9X_07720 [Catenulispora yoronensis]
MISLPGDVAAAEAPGPAPSIVVPNTDLGSAPDADIAAMAEIIEGAGTVAIFGGEGAPGPATRSARSPTSCTLRSATASRASSGWNTTTRTPSA